MIKVWLYALGSVALMSLLSFVGMLTLAVKANRLKQVLIYFVSFSAGALFGGAFLHLLPEIVKEAGFGINISLYALSGIAFMFAIEKVVHWNHCHMPITKEHVHPFSIMNLVGDSVHNFIDGLIIGASYLVDVQVGIATTIAVALHEIPQEIGDFGVLLHGGFTRSKALLANFMISLTSILGAVVALMMSSYIESLTLFIIPFAAGGFIYIAGSDLIPELHKECAIEKSFIQLLAFILGVGVMLGLLLLL